MLVVVCMCVCTLALGCNWGGGEGWGCFNKGAAKMRCNWLLPINSSFKNPINWQSTTELKAPLTANIPNFTAQLWLYWQTPAPTTPPDLRINACLPFVPKIKKPNLSELHNNLSTKSTLTLLVIWHLACSTQALKAPPVYPHPEHCQLWRRWTCSD